MSQGHDWTKLAHAWFCATCRACLVEEACERFGMEWPPADRDAVRLVDIEFIGPCWPKAPVAERELERWKWSVAGQPYAARVVVAEAHKKSGRYAPDPVP